MSSSIRPIAPELLRVYRRELAQCLRNAAQLALMRAACAQTLPAPPPLAALPIQTPSDPAAWRARASALLAAARAEGWNCPGLARLRRLIESGDPRWCVTEPMRPGLEIEAARIAQELSELALSISDRAGERLQSAALLLMSGDLGPARLAFAQVLEQQPSRPIREGALIGLACWGRAAGQLQMAAGLLLGPSLEPGASRYLRLRSLALALEAGHASAVELLVARLNRLSSRPLRSGEVAWLGDLHRRLEAPGARVPVHPGLIPFVRARTAQRTPTGALCRVLLAG